jgi:hypothetical protein
MSASFKRSGFSFVGIPLTDAQKITVLEFENKQLQEELAFYKRIARSAEDSYWRNVDNKEIDVEDLKSSLDVSLNKIFDAVDILTQIQGKSISIPDHVVSVK